MKQRTLILSLLFPILIGCTGKKQYTRDEFSISVIESYNAIQLFPAFLEVNTILVKAKTDSAIQHPTGISLLDRIKQDTTQRSNSIDDYPFWQVFIPQTMQGKDGNSYVDESSILGFSMINDTIKVLQYLRDKEISKLFPGDIEFIFAKGVMMSEYLKMHGIKKGSGSIRVDNSGITKLFIKREGVAAKLGGIAEKVEDLKGDSKYSLKLQLDSKILSQLTADTYTIVIKVNDNVYSGSIVKHRINDLIPVGEIENEMMEVLKSEFKDKIIIE